MMLYILYCLLYGVGLSFSSFFSRSLYVSRSSSPFIKQNRPGPPGLAAISPEAVANAAVAGVLGKVNGSIDGFNAIMAVQ